MKKVLLVLSFAFVLALSSKAVMPAQAYAAENLEPGGTNYSNAEQLLIGKQYTGTALRQGDGRCWYYFKTTGYSHVSYKIWGVNYKDRGGFYGKDNVAIKLYDADGEQLDGIDLNSDGRAGTLPLTNLKRNTTYYLRIYTYDYDEDADFTMIIKQVVPKPGKVYLKSVKPGKKKLTVKWAAVPYATKYQVQYRKKGASKWKTRTTTKTRITLKKLKKGKKYQVRVRAIRVVSGKSYKGKYSKKVTKKVK